VVVGGPGGSPPPVLTARAGREEAHIGDTLTVARGTSIVAEVTVPAALAGGRVDFVWDGASAESATTTVGAPARFERTVQKDGYVRAHVQATDGSPVAVTNPVFVKVRAAR
jgi:hypothetical protein